MHKKKLPAPLALAALATAFAAPSAQALTWSDTFIGYRYGTEFREPNNRNDVEKHVLQFTHASGYSVGQNFVNLDVFQSDDMDPADGDRIGDYELDANDSFAMSVELGNGALGVIHASRWATGYSNTLRLELFGSKGGLQVVTDGKKSWIACCAGADIDTQTWRELTCPPSRPKGTGGSPKCARS